ncbi:hypothetical protein NMK71_03770 [Weeksellaceae bacterium KMM 9713]|uniref:Lipoprotein n=1 Tax=Profundicola chukchiensis TaxID=2961959 RepID=A0A9X4MZT4_9FLAO|nr:hypothetical protein [Profundicola chukchiensis]MDG4945521.1 hypothetical protein [Profundicola chukchiensis]
MKNLCLILFSLVFVFSCKNDANSFGNHADYAIQSTEKGKILLRFKPEIGSKTSTMMRFEINPEGILPNLDSELIADFNMRVASVEDSVNICHVDFQRFRMTTNIMGAKVKYDSQSDENSLPAALTSELEKFLGKKAIMQVDTLAQVRSVKIDEEEKVENNTNFEMDGQFISFPVEAMGVGDSWVVNKKVSSIGDVGIKYTVDKISDDEVVIQVDSGENQNDARLIKGQYLMDRKSGFIKRGDLNIKDSAKKLTINLSLESTIE